MKDTRDLSVLSEHFFCESIVILKNSIFFKLKGNAATHFCYDSYNYLA